MNGIYLTNYDTKNTFSGVSKKIQSQVQVLIRYGVRMDIIDVNSIMIKQVSCIKEQLMALIGFNNGNTWLKLFEVVSEKMSVNNYDFIYVRHTLFDSHQVRFFKRIKEKFPKLKLLIEIPTYPYDGEVRLSQWLMFMNDKRVRNHLSGIVDRFVTYSKDQVIFNIPTIVLSNGIDYEKIRVRTPIKHKGINVIAVALFEEWHGYDRFLDGMIKQQDVVKQYNINFYLAGKGKILSKYKKQVEEADLADYVHFCGELHNESLNDLYDIADIALDCMGRHRVGVYYNSSLKGKEYCAHGVPIISGIETEMDSITDFPYYKRVPADDTLINMNDVVEYYNLCYKKTDVNSLVAKIREDSRLYFDFDNAFRPVLDYIKEN